MAPSCGAIGNYIRVKVAKNGAVSKSLYGPCVCVHVYFWLEAVTVRWTPKSGYTIGAIEALNYFDVTPLNPPRQSGHQVMHWERSQTKIFSSELI